MNSSDDWKMLKIAKIAKIERLVAEFVVWSIGLFPSAKVKVKVVEDTQGYYIGRSNLAAKSRQGGSPDWISGTGKTIVEALEKTIENLLASIAENGAASESDFEWSDPQDF